MPDPIGLQSSTPKNVKISRSVSDNFNLPALSKKYGFRVTEGEGSRGGRGSKSKGFGFEGQVEKELFEGDGVKANIVTEDMVKENVIIIDIGINFVNEKLVGDVDFNGVKDKCSYITPVPGGVGPMTVTALLLNTLDAAIEKGVLVS